MTEQFGSIPNQTNNNLFIGKMLLMDVANRAYEHATFDKTLLRKQAVMTNKQKYSSM